MIGPLERIKNEIADYGTSYVEISGGRFLLVDPEEFEWIIRELNAFENKFTEFIETYLDVNEKGPNCVGEYLDLLERISFVREGLWYQYHDTIKEIEAERERCQKTQFSKNSIESF